MRHHFSFAFLALAALTACSAEPSSPDTSTAPTTPSDGGADATPAPSCTKPATGMFMADLVLSTTCPWWKDPKPKDAEIIRLLEDSVQFPYVDDFCGVVTWATCSVETVNCGPMKINGGGGWIGRGTMKMTYTDDTHVEGTVTFDVGPPCKTVFVVKAEKLDLH